MRRTVGVVIGICALGGGAAPSASGAASFAVTAPVSGTFRVNWTTRGADPSAPTEASGAVLYTVEERLRAPDAGAAWIDEPLPDFAAAQLRRFYDTYVKVRLSVESYRASANAVCQDGTAAHETSTVLTVAQPHALLEFEVPTLDLLSGRGRADVNMPFAVRRDGPVRLGQVVFGTGAVTTHAGGTDCLGGNADGIPTATPVDRDERTTIERLMSQDVVAAVDDDFETFPLTVGPDGSTTMRGTQPLVVNTDPSFGHSTGSVAYDLHVAGPPLAQQAFCSLPSYTRMSRLRSLTAARALLRRAGFGPAVFGGDRPDTTRRGRFFLKSGSPFDLCGRPLGSRKYPVLYRSRGIVRPGAQPLVNAPGTG